MRDAVCTKVAKRSQVGGNLGLFFRQIGDYAGSIIEINANLSYRVFSFLSLGAGLAIFSVDVQAEAPDFHGEIRYRYTGPGLTAMVFF